MRKSTSAKVICTGALAALAFTSANQALAAGYEKATMWGAHEAGLGGAATPWVSGADALFYNPAGLVKEKPGSELSLQLSPGSSTTSAPIDFQNDSVSSSAITTMPLALIYNGTITDSIGFGIGGYVAGGAKAEYDNVTMPGTLAGQTTDYTNLADTEIALGVGWKVTDALKIGASYRVSMATASFGLTQPIANSTAAFANLQVNNVHATDYSGFKLGAQYKVAEHTTLGLTYRSEANLKGDGNYAGSVSAGTGVYAINPTNANVHTVLPQAITVGAEQSYEHWNTIIEYVWTQYSRVGEIPVAGVATFATPGGNQALGAGFNVHEGWQDQHEIRIGGEYLGWALPLRFAYTWDSNVGDTAYANPVLYPPGMTHTFSVGTGHTWFDGFTTDIAAQYFFDSASGGTAASGQAFDSSGANFSRSGTYSVSAYTIHLGATWAF